MLMISYGKSSSTVLLICYMHRSRGGVIPGSKEVVLDKPHSDRLSHGLILHGQVCLDRITLSSWHFNLLLLLSPFTLLSNLSLVFLRFNMLMVYFWKHSIFFTIFFIHEEANFGKHAISQSTRMLHWKLKVALLTWTLAKMLYLAPLYQQRWFYARMG